MKRKTILASALAAAVLPSCGGKKESADAVLSFSAIPDQNKTELKENFDKIADYLSRTPVAVAGLLRRGKQKLRKTMDL